MPPNDRSGFKLLNWASNIEEGTLEQARATASMAFVRPHVALMPDAHQGLGSAVGTVIPTRDAVIPAAVGVDIGCTDADTEFLSDRGWVRMADWCGHRVMQYEPSTGTGRLVIPERYVERDQDWFYHLRTKYGVDQMLSSDHKMLVWRITGRSRRREQQVLSAEEFVALDRDRALGYKAEFATTFDLPEFGNYTSWASEWTRVQVMVAADATITDGAAVLHLRKQRKIDRAQKLLTELGLDFTIKPQKDGATYIRFRWVNGKDLQRFWSASPQSLAVIADEVFHWDGNAEDQVFYTRKKADADLVQYAFTATRRRATITADHRNSGVDYRVVVSDHARVGFTGRNRLPIERVPSSDGKAYCFTVPSGFLVLRRNGNVFITGNCGMIGVRTIFNKDDLGGKDLQKLLESVERSIPLSPGNYNHSTDRFEFTAARIEKLEAGAVASNVDLSHSPKWREQLGSLGGGNHFIELCLDETDQAWMFLHSGSRGVGNKIAQRHIKKAKQLCKIWHVPLPNDDLAFLPQGTPEFTQYIKEMRWAQEFALENRDEMMDRFRRELTYWMRGNADDADQIETERIQCHHNYTQVEKIGKENVWITRKGAIDAHEGVRGIIPGSMGTRSYVVRGLGNAAALNSAPHGAGRAFSRKAARERFTVEDLEQAMTGITYRAGEQWVDEIPGAYKNINVVMKDAEDLVEVEHILRQVLNLKGE